MSCSKTHFVKRKSDSKILQIRLCQVFKKSNDGDFDLIWQFYNGEKWVTDDNICSPDYSFHVEKKEIESISHQILLS